MYEDQPTGGSTGITFDPDWPGIDPKPDEIHISAGALQDVANALENNRPSFAGFEDGSALITTEHFASDEAAAIGWSAPVILGTSSSDASTKLAEFVGDFLTQYDLAIALMRKAAGIYTNTEDSLTGAEDA